MNIHLKKSTQIQNYLKTDPQFAHLNIIQINYKYHGKNRNKEDI